MPDLEHERQLLRRRLLGWGLACEPILPGVDIGRDLALSRGPNGLDFARVEGMDNLTQVLTIAMTTLLGSDLFNTQFGFDGLNALVEETNPILARERIRIAIIQVLRKDPRIRRILDVKLDGGQLEPLTAGNRELHVRVGFETISGDQAGADLGRVIANV